MRMLVTLLGAALLVAAPGAADPEPDSGRELIGRHAPAFAFDRWIRTRPLALEDLRGKVVLVRWWTDGCPYCETTLPVLEKLRVAHAAEGLVVIGAYHPKPPRAVSDRSIERFARQRGFGGPIAVDRDWTTLGRYWLDGHPEHDWTSVSFLIDRDGRIRWVHGGGEYHPSTDPAHARCAAQYAELERTLATVLGERSRPMP